MFEGTVDRFSESATGGGAVEEPEYIGRTALEGSAQADDFGELLLDLGSERVDHAFEPAPFQLLVGPLVRRDEALVDAPGGVELGVLLVGE